MKRPPVLAGALTLALLLAAIAGPAHAQGPGPGGEMSIQATLMGTAFTYQGKLEAGGEPVNDDCDVAFRLYDDPNGGSQVGSAITRTVPISDGLFAVVLDFGGDIFTGDARWLEIRVKCSGDSGFTTLTPRQALTPAPYALALPGLWTQQNTTSPNLIGGYSGNSVTAGVVGGTIGGGGVSTYTNRVTDDYGTVGGGLNNQAGDNAGGTSDAPFATVGGGEGNVASQPQATVGGGYGNVASHHQATVGGGFENTASGFRSTVGGGVWNGATGDWTTVAGGAFNIASGEDDAIGGGYLNRASAEFATIGGGYGHNASGGCTTIGGGYQNTASGGIATIGGGHLNTASAVGATVPGGIGNAAGGDYSFAAGGENNAAQGDYSFAAGRRAKANHHGSFVWADSTDADFASQRYDQFRVRANGGARFDVNNDEWVQIYDDGTHLIETSTGAYLTLGGAWTDSSDLDLKENLAPVDGQEVLARLADLPITTWNYQAEGPSIRHMGPVAQDFYAAFGLGQDERHLAPLDTGGVALAAIQALYEHAQALEAENVALREQVTALRQENAAQQAHIDDLGARVVALEGAPTNRTPLLQSGLLPGAGLLIASLGLVWVTRRGGALSLSKGGGR
jgi:hypothetical protein